MVSGELLDSFIAEVRDIERTLGLSPRRPLPKWVKMIHEAPGIHGTSSLKGETLYISDEIGEIGRILRKEAFSLMLSPKADAVVPQAHDLAWVASGIPRDLWERARVPPPRIFGNYDPYILTNLRTRKMLQLIGSLISVINSSMDVGEMDFFTYFALLRRIVIEEVNLSESDLTVLRALTKNPGMKPKEIKEQSGISEPTISRSVRKLRSLGFLFGPENVNINKLNLTTILVEYPNRRDLRNAFWDFPFTYNQMIPVSRTEDALALLVMPSGAIPSLAGELTSLGLKVYKSKVSFHDFQTAPEGDMWKSMANALDEIVSRKGYFCEGPKERRFRLSKDDLRILNHVMLHGRVTLTEVRAMGISSPKYRITRLRSNGLIMRRYFIELPKGLDSLYLKVRCNEKEFPRIARAVGAASACTIHFIEGPGFEGCAGIAFVRKEMKGDFAAALSSLLGDRLSVLADILVINPLWLIPVELWDERSQSFSWEAPLSNLLSKIFSLLSSNEIDGEKR